MEWSMTAVVGVIRHPLNGHRPCPTKGVKSGRYWKEKQLVLMLIYVYSYCSTVMPMQGSLSQETAHPCHTVIISSVFRLLCYIMYALDLERQV